METKVASHSQADQFRSSLWVLLSACCFGTVPPLTVIATEDGTPLQVVQLWRYAITAILLILVAIVTCRRNSLEQQHDKKFEWNKWDIIILGGGAQFAVASLSLSALKWLPAATAAFLFYTYPAWVTVFSAAKKIETIDKTKMIALSLALLGTSAMVGMPGGKSLSVIGISLALAAAIIYAVYIPAMSIRQQGITPLAIAISISVGGTACFILWCLVSGELLTLPSPQAASMSLFMGVLTAFAFYGFLRGLEGLGPVRAAILSTVEPIWTAVLGLIILSQKIGPGTLIGGLGILSAVIMLQLKPQIATKS